MNSHICARPEKFAAGFVVQAPSMAARTRKIRHDDETRAKIKASQLINRLEDHVFNNAAMSKTQITAAAILLRKVLPDLSAVEQDVQHGISDELADLLSAIDSRTRGVPRPVNGVSPTATSH